MIDFRYHIVSLIAVFLALALGLFLGSTTLQSTVTHNLHNQANRVTGQNRKLEAKNKLLNDQLHDQTDVTKALEPYAVSGRLTGATVAIVSAPGVDSGDADDLVKTLQSAGATITANVALQSAYLDPTQDAELGALAAEIALPKHPLPGGNGATQVSSVLAQVLLTRPGRHVPSRAKVDAALSALADGKFISSAGDPVVRPATLGIVLTAAPVKGVSAATAQAQNAALIGLAQDLRGVGTGVAVVGPTPASGNDDSALVAARADSALTKVISTVSLDPQDGEASGRIAVVVALQQAPSGTVGSYGLGSGAGAPLPAPSPTS